MSKHSGCWLVCDVEPANQHHDIDSMLWLSSVRNIQERHKRDKENKIFHCCQAWTISVNKLLPDVKYYRNIYFALLSAASVPFLKFSAHLCHIFLFIDENWFMRVIASFNSCCCDLSGPAVELTDLMTGTWTSTLTARTSTPAESAVESLSHAVSKTRQWVLKKILWNGLFSKALSN